VTYDDWKAHDDTPVTTCEVCGFECLWPAACSCCDACAAPEPLGEGTRAAARLRDRIIGTAFVLCVCGFLAYAALLALMVGR